MWECELPFEKYPDLDGVKDLVQKYEDDAGYDLQAFGILECPCLPDDIPETRYKSLLLQSLKSYKMFCGIRVNIPANYMGLIVPRSSFRNQGLICQAIWDAGYTGWVMPFVTTSGMDIEIESGSRVLQLIIFPKPKVISRHIFFDTLPKTLRGDRGVGSTGK